MTAVRPSGSNARPRDAASGGRGTHVHTVATTAGADDDVDVGAVQTLALEQCLGHLVEDLEVVLQEALGAVVGVEEETAQLVVDLDGGLLGVLGGLGEVAAEE